MIPNDPRDIYMIPNDPRDFSSFYRYATNSAENASNDSKIGDSENGKLAAIDNSKKTVLGPPPIKGLKKTVSGPLPIKKIEQDTLTLISRMLTLADGMERTGFTIEINDEEEDDHKDFPGRSFSIGPTALTRSYCEGDTDTHFDGRPDDNTPLQLTHIARTSFSRLAKIFLGQDAFNRIRSILEQQLPLVAKLFWGQKAGKENLQTLVQQQQEFEYHDTSWKESIRPYWTNQSDFQTKMDLVFESAQKLLAKKKEDEKKAYLCRIALYASLAFSVIGKSMGQRAISILGVGGSAVTLFCLNLYYSWYHKDATSLQKDTIDAYSIITGLEITC